MNDAKLYEKAVVEMFRRVGLVVTFEEAVAYGKEHGEQWFQTRSWSKAEQDDYITWLTRQIKFRHKALTKEYCEKKARWFVFDIGWSLKEEE